MKHYTSKVLGDPILVEPFAMDWSVETGQELLENAEPTD